MQHNQRKTNMTYVYAKKELRKMGVTLKRELTGYRVNCKYGTVHFTYSLQDAYNMGIEIAKGIAR